jgi:excisionase family DNA binding protein
MKLLFTQGADMNKSFVSDEKDDKALTTEDACEFLSISRQTLYKLVKSKKIPGRKVGDNYRFLKSDLIRYFKND